MKKSIIIVFFMLAIVAFASILLVNASAETDCRYDCACEKKIDSQDCSFSYISCKEDCSNNKSRSCMNICAKEKTTCFKEVKSDYTTCSKKCLHIGKNISCLNGKYNAGDVFLDKCQICECGYNSRVSCKKTDFCNFNEVLYDKEKCESNNGLYQQLCNGPYFDIVCSQNNFCLCEGIKDYSCPENYYCLHEFNPSLSRRGYTIIGWKTLLGAKLGDIGICVKKPQLENCGNGICENIIKDNKQAETRLNCPEDCH